MSHVKLGYIVAIAAVATVVSAASVAPPRMAGPNDISGTVTGPKGAEAGVWVIAETNDLPTKFAKIVVTDDRGRYVIPELPSANYDVWVRGYGLVDSPKKRGRPGATMNHTAVVAPNPRAAAEYYPAGYWYSLMKVPAASEFPGTGPDGNGIATFITNQQDFVRQIKNNACLGCHQMGSKGTRELHPALGTFPSSVHAWGERLKAGQAGGAMAGMVSQMGPRTLQMFADWTDRIAAGEVPPTPPRPQGVERNVVITMWDWADPKVYLHDLVSTDRRNPTLNANGRIYGVLEASADYLPVLDPKTHTVSRVPVTLRDSSAGPAVQPQVAGPSPYWGTEPIWNSKANVHNPMFDERGRVWITSRVRPPNASPAFCKAGSSHPSARVFPLNASGRHIAVYDPKTKEMKHISTCFGTHHLMFAEDANRTLWTSGGGQVIGWVNTKLWDETGDEEKAQGWTPLILDFNGNGRRDEYTEPNMPADSSKDRRLLPGQYGSAYALAPAPDGSVWGTMFGYPGAVFRLSPGANPSETALTERFELPMRDGKPMEGFSPRGGDVDRNGVYWAALASGHLASFDRRKCKGPLNGPTATGQHCPEGWSFYAEPLPNLGNVTGPGSGEGSYYTWVDQFNTLGLGANVPISTGNQSEGLLVLKDGKWVVLRVPYPMGFYTKWLDGRIDNPNTGWKGRGLWATISTRAPFHMEGGKGTTSKVYHFQLRPDPLAR